MSDLLKCYDSYGDLEVNIYFTYHFGTIPSQLSLELPLKANKENMEGVFKHLDISLYEFELIFKRWKTSAINQTEEDREDYPHQYFFKSKTQKLLLALSLSSETLSVEFLYDVTDEKTEHWILTTTQALRKIYGKEKTPTFKVLSKGRGGFYTEEVQINKLDINIKQLYNDDFEEVHGIIQEALQVERSGLILLHGVPGTGKTSYIKSLFGQYADKDFIFIPNDFVNELLQPDFVSFLLVNKSAIILIEDAEKVIINRENANSNSVVSTILQLTDGLFSDYLNIKIICTFNTSMDKIDKALLRKGRMIAFYEFQPLSVPKTQALMASLGHEAMDKEMTLAEIFNYDKKGFEDHKSTQKIGFGSRR